MVKPRIGRSKKQHAALETTGKSTEIHEGRARLLLEGFTSFDATAGNDTTARNATYKTAKGPASSAVPVFYNPVMRFNRDITLLVLHALQKKKMQAGLPMEGSGVRAIRIIKELPASLVSHVSCNDHDSRAYEKMQELMKRNKIPSGKVTVSMMDADLFFEQSNGFDYIDIDPFGSPMSFLPMAIKRLAREGILGVTATDTSALTGTYPRTTLRKYWSRSLKNELLHELSVRILIRAVQMLGTLYDKALIPIYSYAQQHYVRVFFRCEKGRTRVDELIAQHQYVQYDPERLELRVVRELLGGARNNDTANDTAARYAGPLWTGKLWDAPLAAEIAKNKLQLSLDGEERRVIEQIAAEAAVEAAAIAATAAGAAGAAGGTPLLGFIDLPRFSKRFKQSPRIAELCSFLQQQKIPAARTHFSRCGIRTTISGKELSEMLE